MPFHPPTIGNIVFPGALLLFCSSICWCRLNDKEKNPSKAKSIWESKEAWQHLQDVDCDSKVDLDDESLCKKARTIDLNSTDYRHMVETFLIDQKLEDPSGDGEKDTLVPSNWQEGKILAKQVCTGSCTAFKSCSAECQCLALSLFIFWFSGTCTYQKKVTFDDGLKARGLPSSWPQAIINMSSDPSNGTNSSSIFTNQTSPFNLAGLGTAVPLGRHPAPCNASYVSYACANSTDGIVHEPLSNWLGA